MIDREADELGRLDSIAGDGDHGIGMQRGSTAADEAAGRASAAGAGIGTLLAQAGDAWADKAGGTSGALWGAALRAAGETLRRHRRPERRPWRRGGRRPAGTPSSSSATPRSGTRPWWTPWCRSLTRSPSGPTAVSGLVASWTGAAEQATAAAAATADLLPRLGRARPHLEKSRGTPDPGAISFGLVVTAIG